MPRTPHRTARKAAAMIAMAGSSALAFAAVSPGASSSAAAATGMTPAVGAQPHYQRVGAATTEDTVFKCQKTVPAGCYGPTQMRAAYGVDQLAKKGLDGSGRTIVIIDAYSSPNIVTDLAKFNAQFNLPAADFEQIAPDGLTPFDAGDNNQVGWSGEITLDVEWAHAIAPGAKIKLVLAKSNNDADILSATKYAVDNNIGDVISQSFGEGEVCMDPALITQQHAIFADATRRGITLLASAGDQGSAQPGCTDGAPYFKSASTPASDPNVTSVGGTMLDADGLTGAYHSETVWNEPDFGDAGGGGFSVLYGVPSYQQGHLHLQSRGVPDVSYNAGIMTGVLAVWSPDGTSASQGTYRFGGTSAGSPQWAGLVALADQLAQGRIGAMNKTLYSLSQSKKNYANDFHDIVVGDNHYPGDPIIAGFAATPGWDAASGLGSPKADALIPELAKHLH